MAGDLQPQSKLPLIIYTIIFFIAAGFGLNKLYIQAVDQKIEPTAVQSVSQSTPPTSTLTTNPTIATDATKLPAAFKLPVPFTSQAPNGNWDQLHDTACEEAASIIVNAYYAGVVTLEPKYVEDQIDMLTKWEDDNFGYHLDITTKETTQMIEDVYHLKTAIVDTSESAIKQALVDEKLVIIPTNGQLLNNPNYKAPGPIYHMLVITGYDTKGFITNDPGTKRGESYKYTYDTLYNSNGGWSHSLAQVDLNYKKMILVSQY